ncbi:MAG: cob(I)yrinic acid a,c-diamide adenosyltransferase [Clostridia bacterium]|nr:cob(I)yrinic acid a,c-diamide adenosyltransferase [Clostridia bacterium]
MKQTGLIQVYIGDGKGKTTAAVGQSIRALGWRYKVMFSQFLKNSETGERHILSSLENLDFVRPPMRNMGFIWDLDGEALAETREDLNRGFEDIMKRIFENGYDLVVLDELLDVIDCGFIEEERLFSLLNEKPDKTEIILTGRKASDSLKAKADYISVITGEKHPYERGIKARKGIEY